MAITSKSLKTLVKDIYTVLEEGVKDLPQEVTRAFGEQLSELVVKRLTMVSETPRLRMSNLGTKCLRKLWYTVNKPELAEKLPGPVRMKFLFGDIIEQLVLFLAEVAGHEVVGRQTKLNFCGVEGSRDAVINGILVDVKSASSHSFSKFTSGLKQDTDPFGYIEQLSGYKAGDEQNKEESAAFIAVDKQLGHIHVDEHKELLLTKAEVEQLINDKRAAINQSEPPERYYSDEADGKSGNRKLCTECSYCSFKRECWPNLRVFAYSSGPRFLTKVERLPDVPEISEE